MELKIKDICEMLQVSEKTVYRWIDSNKIPAYKINYQYRFKKQEIEEWISKNKILFSKKEIKADCVPLSVFDLLKKGGIFFNIAGDNVYEILSHALSQIPIPETVKKETLINSLMQREEMASTSIGNGIAIPHSRNPVISDVSQECLSICFLKKPVQYGAIDNQPVHTLFILLASLPKRHVEILSRISHLCLQNDFIKLLTKQASQEEIFSYIHTKETEWKERKIT